MSKCSSVENPQTIIATLPFPDQPIPPNRSLNLLIDRVADPGNLGTIPRTAVAANVELVRYVRIRKRMLSGKGGW